MLSDLEKHFVGTTLIEVGEGWHQLILELHNKLKAIDQNYKIIQVKEKFGGLRFYTTTESLTEDNFILFHNIIEDYENRSYHICERCGQEGTLISASWVKTLCPIHAAQIGEQNAQ